MSAFQDKDGKVLVVGGTGTSADHVQGNVAHGVADSGNPVKTGGVYKVSLTNLGDGQRGDTLLDVSGNARVQLVGSGNGASDTMAAGNVLFGTISNTAGTQAPLVVEAYAFNGTDRVRFRADTNGLAVQPALSANFWQYAAAAGGIVSSVADVALRAAGAAGVRNFLSSIQIAHDTLSAVTEFVIKDGAAIIYRGKLQTAAVDSSAGAGTIKFDPPLRGTAATALNFALLTSVTGGVFVNGQGYTGS